MIEALFRGLMERDGGPAVHFAAMLYYLHGEASTPFDWEQRPFFLRFKTSDMVEREKAFRELYETIGVTPDCCSAPVPYCTDIPANVAFTICGAAQTTLESPPP